MALLPPAIAVAGIEAPVGGEDSPAPQGSTLSPGISISTSVTALGLPSALMEQLVVDLGGDWASSTLSDLFAVQTVDLESTLQALQVEGRPVSPMVKGQLIRAIRRLAEVAGLDPPALGAPLAPVAKAPGPVPTQQSTDPPSALPSRKRKFSQVLQQGDDREFAPLPAAKLRALRKDFNQNNGRPAREYEAAADEQLSAGMASAAASGESTAAESTSARNLGIASDAVTLGGYGVRWGFGIARMATNVGFGVASVCLRRPAGALEEAAGPNAVSSVLHGVSEVVGLAHKATQAGQGFAEVVTQASLSATKMGLSAAGAKQGELLRLAVGQEAADAIITVEAIVRDFTAPIADAPPMPVLLEAAQAWGAMQHAAAAQAAVSAPAGVEDSRVALPENAERWLRFTAATFGAAWFAGLVEGFSVAGVRRARDATAQGGGAGEAAIAAAGLEGRIEVLAFEQKTTEVFTPGYLVAVDHGTSRVVVALRGTSSVADALADLVCEPAPVQLGGHDGMAHGGMLRAARRLESTLAELVDQALGLLDCDPAQGRVVLCGHSLGAGVAALVAALWRDAGRFPSLLVECFAFACPQVLDPDLALAQSNHTTSVIVGTDLVPRFSLATAKDLRTAMLLISDPEAGHSASEILAAEARGDTRTLAAAYAALRPEICTSPGRLFPSGQLLHLQPEQRVRMISHGIVDELFIASDMASAHLPRSYLLALQGHPAAQGRI